MGTNTRNRSVNLCPCKVHPTFLSQISCFSFIYCSTCQKTIFDLKAFANDFFKDQEAKNKWTAEQRELLLCSEVLSVIENIKELSKDKNKGAAQLIAYYQSNIDRMDYKRYLQIGNGLIGSGAIESAHRTVIQKRMKQSGQRWSVQGAQNMLQLRATRKNGQWSKIITLTKTNIKKVA